MDGSDIETHSLDAVPAPAVRHAAARTTRARSIAGTDVGLLSVRCGLCEAKFDQWELVSLKRLYGLSLHPNCAAAIRSRNRLLPASEKRKIGNLVKNNPGAFREVYLPFVRPAPRNLVTS